LSATGERKFSGPIQNPTFSKNEIVSGEKEEEKGNSSVEKVRKRPHSEEKDSPTRGGKQDKGENNRTGYEISRKYYTR